jgi:hypothetical protein
VRLSSFTFIKFAAASAGTRRFPDMPPLAGLKKPFFRPTSPAAFSFD